MLRFSAELAVSDPARNAVLIVGQTKHLAKLQYETIKVKLEPRVPRELYASAVRGLHPSPTDSVALYLNCATLAALPSTCSRHAAPSRAHALTRIVRSCVTGSGDEFIVLVCEKADLFASVCAIARSFPLYSRKSSGLGVSRTVTVEIVLVGSDTVFVDDLACIEDVTRGVRIACRVTDTPCSEMHTDAFVKEICDVGRALGLEPTVITGEDLAKQGFGGVYAVGKAAVHLPAFVVLSHEPEGATKSIAWVGKGIVYDTGGLSLKSKAAMPGMKHDCGGAAAVLGAFYAAVKQGFTENLHALFCLAENAIGPNALRPDDVITLYSGRTIEVNNTDAEGRLVLGDGVAYAQKNLHADIIVDLATLTGAQGAATGRYHGALLTNNAEWEELCVRAGRASGDLVHPIVFCPELHFSEFASTVADMKNSSADRSNAEVSCAGLFIGAQIGFDFPGAWIHVDMAYPVYMGERATGYGVGLLLALFSAHSTSNFLRLLYPFAKTSPAVDGVLDLSAGSGLDGDSNANTKDESASKKIKLS